MILVDTSRWINHFRKADRELQQWLDAQDVLAHPFVQGELACGQLGRQRAEVLGLFARLPQAPVIEHALVLSFVDDPLVRGRGLGWVDVHLLVSCKWLPCQLATDDRAFANAARAIGITVR